MEEGTTLKCAHCRGTGDCTCRKCIIAQGLDPKGYYWKNVCSVCGGTGVIPFPRQEAGIMTQVGNKAVVRNIDSLFDPNKVFVVHGRDEAMKQLVARVIEKLDLKPIILHEQPNKGQPMINKFTENSNVGFAVVLLSPDDLGCLKGQESNAKARARQNVIFELGFFVGKLGSSRVLPLYRVGTNLELPSDYEGVAYVPFDEAGNWKFELVRELQANGYSVDANKLV